MQPQPTAGYPPHSYAYGGYPQQPQTTSAAPPPAISTVPSSAAAQQYSLPVSAHPGVVYNTQQAWVHQAGPPPAETPVHQQLPIYSPQQQQHPQRQHPQQHSLPQQFGGYVTDSPAPGYGHHYAAPAPPPPPPPPLPAAAATTAAPAPSQHHEQQAVCLPLQATPQQPLPAGPGQSLAAYAYPGTSEVAATGQEQQQQQQHPEYQQQQEQQEQQPPQQLSTPQQVAQQAIAKTLASMQQQQNQALAFDNRRGYLHGNLIGKVGTYTNDLGSHNYDTLRPRIVFIELCLTICTPSPISSRREVSYSCDPLYLPCDARLFCLIHNRLVIYYEFI